MSLSRQCFAAHAASRRGLPPQSLSPTPNCLKRHPYPVSPVRMTHMHPRRRHRTIPEADSIGGRRGGRSGWVWVHVDLVDVCAVGRVALERVGDARWVGVEAGRRHYARYTGVEDEGDGHSRVTSRGGPGERTLCSKCSPWLEDVCGTKCLSSVMRRRKQVEGGRARNAENLLNAVGQRIGSEYGYWRYQGIMEISVRGRRRLSSGTGSGRSVPRSGTAAFKRWALLIERRHEPCIEGERTPINPHISLCHTTSLCSSALSGKCNGFAYIDCSSLPYEGVALKAKKSKQYIYSGLFAIMHA